MSERSSFERGAESAGTGRASVLRSLLFNLLFWIVTSIMAVAVLPALLLPRRAMQKVARSWMRVVQWLLTVVVGLDYEVRGAERIPRVPAIFALKHQSAWETLVCHVLLDDPAIALKRELTQIPLFGWYARRAGMIRIDRGSGARALRSLVEGGREALARGSSIVIFPEGTRVRPGERRPYQPGVAALYLQLGSPVVPVALNSGLFWGRRSFVKRPGRIVIEFLPAIAPGLERRTFMAELEQRLEGATERLLAEARA
ncbi:MAG: lysophospholipid acyltransferase family protein, partial [Geminicoccaceae bacterium]